MNTPSASDMTSELRRDLKGLGRIRADLTQEHWIRKTVAELDAETNYSLDHISGGETMEKSTMSVVELSIRMGICLAKAYELVTAFGLDALLVQVVGHPVGSVPFLRDQLVDFSDDRRLFLVDHQISHRLVLLICPAEELQPIAIRHKPAAPQSVHDHEFSFNYSLSHTFSLDKRHNFMPFSYIRERGYGYVQAVHCKKQKQLHLKKVVLSVPT